MKRTLRMLKKVLPIVVAVIVIQALTISESQAAPPADGGSYHKVRYGETLYSIGRRYGVNPYAIARANGLANPDYIYAGQSLRIPSGRGYNTYSNYNNNYSNYNNHYRNDNNRKNFSNYNNYSNYNNHYNNAYRWRNHYNNYNYGYNRYNRHSGYGY